MRKCSQCHHEMPDTTDVCPNCRYMMPPRSYIRISNAILTMAQVFTLCGLILTVYAAADFVKHLLNPHVDSPSWLSMISVPLFIVWQVAFLIVFQRAKR